MRKEWYCCPICKTKQLMIDRNKKIEGVYIKCRKCNNEIEIRNEPDAEPEPTVKKAV